MAAVKDRVRARLEALNLVPTNRKGGAAELRTGLHCAIIEVGSSALPQEARSHILKLLEAAMASFQQKSPGKHRVPLNRAVSYLQPVLPSADVEVQGGGSGQLAAASTAVTRSKRAAKVKEDRARARASAAIGTVFRARPRTVQSGSAVRRPLRTRAAKPMKRPGAA